MSLLGFVSMLQRFSGARVVVALALALAAALEAAAVGGAVLGLLSAWRSRRSSSSCARARGLLQALCGLIHVTLAALLAHIPARHPAPRPRPICSAFIAEPERRRGIARTSSRRRPYPALLGAAGCGEGIVN